MRCVVFNAFEKMAPVKRRRRKKESRYYESRWDVSKIDISDAECEQIRTLLGEIKNEREVVFQKHRQYGMFWHNRRAELYDSLQDLEGDDHYFQIVLQLLQCLISYKELILFHMVLRAFDSEMVVEHVFCNTSDELCKKLFLHDEIRRRAGDKITEFQYFQNKSMSRWMRRLKRPAVYFGCERGKCKLHDLFIHEAYFDIYTQHCVFSDSLLRKIHSKYVKMVAVVP